jgi:uncharacterized membrane protein
MPSFFKTIAPIDWLALAWFIVCWVGYAWFSERGRRAADGLVQVTHGYRERWAHALLARDNRVGDAALISNLMSSVSFYANTTVYIIAGLVALLGTLDKVMSVAADMPFARGITHDSVELKLLVLLAIFVVAYFKFTWSLRQFNLLTIMVGGAPAAGAQEAAIYARRLAEVNSLAGDDFNRGIRAYYFGIAAVTWMIQPWLFIAITGAILLVLYRRDFRSATLDAVHRP